MPRQVTIVLTKKHVALIPAYNEQRNIREVILHMRRHPHIDVIVIDDGSIDATSKIIKRMGVILVRHEINKGKGEALNTGFRYILEKHKKAKYVVLIDADLQYHPNEAPKILKPLEDGKADFVMGYRDFSRMPFRHVLGNFVWRGFFNLFFGTNFKDTNCGYMAMTTEAIRKIGRVHGGYIIENSMLAQAVRKRLRVRQVLVNVSYKNLSKVPRGIRVVAGVLIFIVAEGFKYRLGIK